MANHIYKGRSFCGGTERYEVFALCGYSEEASGSGRHGIEGLKGTPADCPVCLRKQEVDCPACMQPFDQTRVIGWDKRFCSPRCEKLDQTARAVAFKKWWEG